METKGIKRDEIFIGVLAMKELTLASFPGTDGTPITVSFNDFFGKRITTNLLVEYEESTPLRGMIFRVDDRNLSEDLLFAGKPYHMVFRYKIDGIEFLNYAPSKYDVKKPEKVGTLLKLLGYGETLSSKDLYDFMKNVMDDEYFKTISEFFGIEDGKERQDQNNGLDMGLYQTLLLIRRVNQIDPSNMEPAHNTEKRFENDYLK